jgi:ATP-dependent DNA helicase RecG
LEHWPAIDFTDDREGCLFTATIHRKEIEGSVEPEKSSEKSSEKILALLKATPKVAAREIADTLDITQRGVEKQIAKLREEGRVRRIGPAKGGYWEVSE